jgi:hypothetical protein
MPLTFPGPWPPSHPWGRPPVCRSPRPALRSEILTAARRQARPAARERMGTSAPSAPALGREKSMWHWAALSELLMSPHCSPVANETELSLSLWGRLQTCGPLVNRSCRALARQFAAGLKPGSPQPPRPRRFALSALSELP